MFITGEGRQEVAVGCDEIDGSLEGSTEIVGSAEGEELGDTEGSGEMVGSAEGEELGVKEGSTEMVGICD